MGDYSSGDEATLPSDTTNLEHVYDATDLSNVQTEDSNYVEQTATGEYPIHQYKDTITSSLANITWIGKSDQAPSTYPVYLQIYKTAVPAAWETIATKNTGSAGVDFTLQKLAQDTSTNYKDGSNVVCCRVYQDYSASAGWTFPDNLIEITDHLTVDNTWRTADISAHAPGATGAALFFFASGASSVGFATRAPGESVDYTLTLAMPAGGYASFYAKLDTGQVLSYKAYEATVGELKVYVRAYTTAATWLAAKSDHNTAWGGSVYEDVDVSGDSVPANGLALLTAIASDGNWRQIGIRKNGSSFDQYDYWAQVNPFGMIGPCDASSIFEFKATNESVDLCTYGWIAAANCQIVDPPTDITPAGTGWTEDISLSGAPDGTTGAVILCHNPTGTGYACEYRKAGSTDNLGLTLGTIGMTQTMVGVSVSKTIDLNVGNTGVKIYLMAYIK